MDDLTLAILAERIQALDRRIDERFCAAERRRTDQLEALDKALQLLAKTNAEKHDRIMRMMTVVIAVMGLVIAYFRHVA